MVYHMDYIENTLGTLSVSIINNDKNNSDNKIM